ncbi:MAG TPA: rod shape-determining protein MreD [Bacteroidales bacterium]|nr:rod shape-determining protein MreD [Bacteroidota bacterium]HJN06184.1 rod shape-determining protein MreD [Bacteroidales bacterium]|tara:strand:- start:492 stop:1007 length:516 start_codon:yes stop_codon:yes gene_type:complete
MNNVVLRNIIRFVILMLIQVLVLNNMNLGGYMNPYIYVLFLLLLPSNINRSLLLIIAFVTGLTVDFFGNTLGLHAAACVLLAFLRPGTINLMFRYYEFNPGEEPGPAAIGVRGFLKYALVLVFAHQLLLFYLEVLSISHFFITLYKVVLSTALSTFIMLIAVLLFTKRKIK